MPSMINNYDALLRQFTENDFQLRAVLGVSVFSAVLFLLVLMALLLKPGKNTATKAWRGDRDAEEGFQADGG
ncbi:MAG: hypothetical protein DMG13_17430 [Acidobacteria bacterium]|nr:MAG: hypothetical protein DMG13_17430 [Acidobacteriota bacterium]